MFLGLIVSVFWGCYTFTGSTLPSHLKTIEIIAIQNQTTEPIFGDRLYRALEQGYRTRSNLRKVPQNGHCQLSLGLLSYQLRPLTFVSDKVQSYRLDVRVSVLFKDRINNKILFEEKNLSAIGEYSVEKNETLDKAQERAIDFIVELVINNTVSGW